MCPGCLPVRIENAGARMRMRPAKMPSSEIVCLVEWCDPHGAQIDRSFYSPQLVFDVCPFDNGEDFIAYVASHDVPVVVLDIWMKGMNGLEVLARLCAISPQTHVIVITGHEDAAARITAMQIGTVAFFIKPFDDEEFLEAVHRALGHAPESSSRKPSLWWASRNARRRADPPWSGIRLKSTIQPVHKR